MPGNILNAIAGDVVILATAAAVAWFLHMRTLTGFGVALVWTGGAAPLTGGLAARARRALTQIGQGSDKDPNLGASGLGHDRALGGGDPVLQVLLAIGSSGAFRRITGRLSAEFVH